MELKEDHTQFYCSYFFPQWLNKTYLFGDEWRADTGATDLTGVNSRHSVIPFKKGDIISFDVLPGWEMHPFKIVKVSYELYECEGSGFLGQHWATVDYTLAAVNKKALLSEAIKVGNKLKKARGKFKSVRWYDSLKNYIEDETHD